MFHFLVIMFLFEYVSQIEGSADCGTNKILIKPKGDKATLIIDNMLDDSFKQFDVIKSKTPYNHLFHIHWAQYYGDAPPKIHMFNTLQNRLEIITIRTEYPRAWGFNITIDRLELSDNGTYLGPGDLCWILLVMDMVQTPPGQLKEKGTVRIKAQPQASVVTRPIINATVLWLLNGQPLNNKEYFRIDDGVIRSSKIPRELNGQNVTYRVVQDTGETSDVSLILNVILKQRQSDRHLLFQPSRTSYTLKMGETVPDIICTVDGNPSCSVTWGVHSSDHVLRLGKASSATSGKYTCIAENCILNGTERNMERSVEVMVVDGLDRRPFLHPSKKFYKLKSGETVPDIVCTVDGNPPCSVTWGVHSSDSVLRLGKVSSSSSGEYTCRAERCGNSTERNAEESVYVMVTDDTVTTEERVVFAIIGSVEAFVAICLTICAIRYGLKSRVTAFVYWEKQNLICPGKEGRIDDIATATDTSNAIHSSILYKEGYTELYETLASSHQQSCTASSVKQVQ